MISPPAKFSNQTNNISANNSSAHSLYSRHTTLSLLDSTLLYSTLLDTIRIKWNRSFGHNNCIMALYW